MALCKPVNSDFYMQNFAHIFAYEVRGNFHWFVKMW